MPSSRIVLSFIAWHIKRKATASSQSVHQSVPKIIFLTAKHRLSQKHYSTKAKGCQSGCGWESGKKKTTGWVVSKYALPGACFRTQAFGGSLPSPLQISSQHQRLPGSLPTKNEQKEKNTASWCTFRTASPIRSRTQAFRPGLTD